MKFDRLIQPLVFSIILVLFSASFSLAQEDLSHSWFNYHRVNMLVFLIFFFAVIIIYIERARTHYGE